MTLRQSNHSLPGVLGVLFPQRPWPSPRGPRQGRRRRFSALFFAMRKIPANRRPPAAPALRAGYGGGFTIWVCRGTDASLRSLSGAPQHPVASARALRVTLAFVRAEFYSWMKAIQGAQAALRPGSSRAAQSGKPCRKARHSRGFYVRTRAPLHRVRSRCSTGLVPRERSRQTQDLPRQTQDEAGQKPVVFCL